MKSLVKVVAYGSIAGATALLRLAQAEVPKNNDPLISRGSDIAIHIGFSLLLGLIFAIKSLNSKLERVLIFAFGLSVILIVVLWYL